MADESKFSGKNLFYGVILILATVFAVAVTFAGLFYLTSSIKSQTTFTILDKEDNTYQVLTTSGETLVFTSAGDVSSVVMHFEWESLKKGSKYTCDKSSPSRNYLTATLGQVYSHISNCSEIV